MTTEPISVEIVKAETAAITVPEEIAVIRAAWVKSKHEELDRAELALKELRKAGVTGKLKRVEGRVSFLRKCVKALDAGYVPMPRFDSTLLNIEVEQVPLKALIKVNEATAQKIFDEIRFIAGQEARRGDSWHPRRAPRDPLIVGAVRTPRICLLATDFERANVAEHFRHQHEQFEEHFLLAWWRPEDERPEDMF